MTEKLTASEKNTLKAVADGTRCQCCLQDAARIQAKLDKLTA